ncbi:hypothetical protein CIW62_22195 [Enterobacter cloacae]|uniref:hypothetical protein n=1 Tax=Enterobacter cloacae TaxID=550 RepID=UPI000BA8BE22|nr:hypothetical protein [Enterobacter cloacae]PAN94648.1 hypothetical protein CIW62_22195 [Enterobacter cloacae]HAS1065199.1 hypothetical protein [Enterobacter cloacae]HAS1098054.1 hypothetical protein [Enterobacter cloacae]
MFRKETIFSVNTTRSLIQSVMTLVMLVMGTGNAQSELLHVPVITYLERLDFSSTITLVSYQPYLMDIPQALADSPAKDYNLVNVHVLDWTLYDAEVGGGVFNIFDKSTIKDETVREYLIRLYNNGDFTGVYRKTGATKSPVCQGFVIAHDNEIGLKRRDQNMQVAYSNAAALTTFPIQSSCAELPPLKKYCELKTESIMLDFKTLSRSTAIDATVSGFLDIYCEEATKIELREPFNGVIPLSNGGVAELTQDGHSLSPGTAPLSIETGETRRVKITAKLKELGQSGFFEATSILTLSYP